MIITLEIWIYFFFCDTPFRVSFWSSIFVVKKQEEEEDDDWGEDTTEEAQRRRMDEISDHAKVLTLSDDLERTVEERVNILFDFVKVTFCSSVSQLLLSLELARYLLP